jgi:PrtD family type I secretion system ABC transporter
MPTASSERNPGAAGAKELQAARQENLSLLIAVGIFSFFVNLLMLTGPLYMLNVYDRVLGSGSLETLMALSILVTFLFATMGLLDHVRGRVMNRVGARFQARLDKRVFSATVRAMTSGRGPKEAATGPQDLESIQRLITSPVLMAFFDLPWTPFFVLGIFIFHPVLGMLAMGGGVLLLMIAVLNQVTTRRPLAEASAATQRADMMGRELRQEAEIVQSLGMRRATFQRWQAAREDALDATVHASDKGGSFIASTKAFRLFLQSSVLGLGAYLVLLNELTPGAMIAASILLGRALAPVEMLVGQWALVQRASDAWGNLAVLLGAMPVEGKRTSLPKPSAWLKADQVIVVPPGEQRAALRLISFEVGPGQAVGVIGPSGAGKSTLARALTGVWPTIGGKIRLDGAALDHYDPDVLGLHIGYLPQRVTLLEGTIKENIARMTTHPDDMAVVKAAQRAAAHEMILQLPEGYDTPVGPSGGRLSGGQIQRIGLARAMYGDPVVLVLDEPNSNLDNDGTEALNLAIRTIKAEGKCVFIMAHRPAAIQECDLLLVLEDGNRKAFGPKDVVLREKVKNHKDIENIASRVVA